MVGPGPTGGCEPGHGADPGGFKNKGMLMSTQVKFYALPGLQLTINMPFDEIECNQIVRGTF